MSEDKRRNPRPPADVKVDYRTVGSFITDYSANISQGGVFVKTSIPLPVGEKVRLRVTLPGHELPFALDGVVRWVSTHDNAENRPAGMGIEFLEFSGEVKDQILAFVHAVDGEAAGENPEPV